MNKRKLKNALTSKTVMAYFNTRSTTEVIVDASPVGLAAIITQKKNIDTLQSIFVILVAIVMYLYFGD